MSLSSSRENFCLPGRDKFKTKLSYEAYIFSILSLPCFTFCWEPREKRL